MTAVPAPPTVYRAFLSGMRSPIVAPVTRALIGLPLIVFTTETARYFAWTIEPPITAGFLGANYWASALLAILAAREVLWARGRVSVSVALAFAPLTTVATLLHLDLFHLDTFYGWFWVVAYTVYPIQLGYFLVRQLRAPGEDPPRDAPLPTWVRAILGAQAVVLIPLGIALFLFPGSTAAVWPWTLPPLSAQVVAAWLLAFGVLAAHSIYENDFPRVRCAMLVYPFLGAMQVWMLARFSEDVDWGTPSAWAYVVALGSIFLLGAYGWSTEMRRRAAAALERPVPGPPIPLPPRPG